MYRFLWQPRWIAFHLLVLVAVPACAALGLWQFHRYNEHKSQGHGGEHVQAAAVVPLAQVLTPTEQVTSTQRGRMVTVTGTYDAAHQLVVPGRTLAGRDGSYVLTPLRVAGAPAGTPAVVVNRGFVDGRPDAGQPVPPTGEVTLTGRLEWSEAQLPDDANEPSSLRTGEVSLMATSELLNSLPYSLYDGFVAETQGPGTLTPMPLAKDTGGGDMTGRAWQNLGYTAQWFVFAGAAVFIWWRVVQREVEERREAAEAETRRRLGLDPVAEPADVSP